MNLLITQGVGADTLLSQGLAAAPAPSGGTVGGGSADPLSRFSSVTYRYLGGRSGQPEPSNLPAGPILVRYFDRADQVQVDVMEVVSQDAEPPPGVVLNPEAIRWEQVISWCPLSELDL